MLLMFALTCMFVINLQTTACERLRDPPQITAFIKQQEQTAIRLTTGTDPEAGLTIVCASMEGLLARPGLRLNYIHFSAITTAAAHVLTAAQQSPRFRGHSDVNDRLKALFHRCLQSLQALLSKLDAQAISNVFWSSATLSFNPDDAVPGMVQAQASKFVHFLDVDKESSTLQHRHVQTCCRLLQRWVTHQQQQHR